MEYGAVSIQNNDEIRMHKANIVELSSRSRMNYLCRLLFAETASDTLEKVMWKAFPFSSFLKSCTFIPRLRLETLTLRSDKAETSNSP